MCSQYEAEEIIMRNANESNVVADIESARAKKLFNNFINRPEAREEYMTALHVMAEQGVTPGYIRYLMQYSYQEAVKDCERDRKPASYGGELLGTEL